MNAVITSRKIILFIFILVFLVACQNNKDDSLENDLDINTQEHQLFYIYPIRYDITTNLGHDVFTYTIAIGSYPFNIFGNSPLYDEEFAEINQILFQSSTEWLKESGIDPNPDWVTSHGGPRMPYVVLDNGNLISVVTRYFLGSESRFDWFIHAVNINLETSSKMTLADIVDLNDNFIIHVQQGGFLNATDVMLDREEASLLANEFIANLTMEEARSFFENVSIDPLQIILESGSLLESSTFYLEPGRISIIYHGGWRVPMHIVINLEDIEEFLKIPKW